MTDYDNVFLLEVDTIPLQLPQPIYDRDCHATLVRGNGEEVLGSAEDGGRSLVGEVAQEHRHQYEWCQRGGINTGISLLQPCKFTLDVMISELQPEQLPSPGPDQDYLPHVFASAPWHALDVRRKYQIRPHDALFHGACPAVTALGLG